MDKFRVKPEDVSSYFSALARRDFFEDIVVIGRFKSDAISEEKEDGYEFYVASSTSTENTVNLIKDATKEWL